MFDLLTAYNQAMLLLLAAACIAVGGLLLGLELMWRIMAVRVSGTIIGVRETKPNIFRTVYRFVLPSGQSCEATSSIGSNRTKGRDTGRTVPLLVFPHRPDEVSEAGSVIAGVSGAVFILGAFWPLHAALSEGRVPLLTWGIVAVILAFVARSFMKHVIPAAQRASPSQWKQERLARYRAALAAVPVRPIEEVLSTVEARERPRQDRKSFRVRFLKASDEEL